MLGDYTRQGGMRSRIRYSPESIRGAVARMASRTYRNRDGNLYVRYLYRNDGRWNWSNNWLGSDWDGSNPAAVRAS